MRLKNIFHRLKTTVSVDVKTWKSIKYEYQKMLKCKTNKFPARYVLENKCDDQQERDFFKRLYSLHLCKA